MFHTLQILSLTIIITVVRLKAEPPEFRILAPEFVCPKDAEATLVKPDSIIITVRTKAGAKLRMTWTVRWSPLPAPAQRSTLLLWRATRALEKKLNGPQPEPFVYAIKNDELLPGVNYIFNVTASTAEGEHTLKSFHINNVQGDHNLERIEGHADLLSVVLVGGQETYADVEFAMEALVTTCYPTQDYYFDWTIQSTETDDKVDTALTSSRLEIPANSLRAGLTYLVTCQVIRESNGDYITQTDLAVRVLRRRFEVYLNVEHLTVPINAAFTLECLVVNHDYFGDHLTYEWQCTSDNKSCDLFQNATTNRLVFENGLPEEGKYEVALTVSVQEHSAAASAVIITVQHTLPVIQISPLPRVLNEGTKTVLVANVSNVTPLCSLTWYFAGEEFLQSQNQVVNDSCDDCQHGEPLTETLTIYSLEENFLDELTDFSNETEWRQVTAEMPAAQGRARFVAECACRFMFACDTSQGTVYAEMLFELNRIPKANDVMVGVFAMCLQN
ncbi:uncharacterized protein isoform X1 [Choristoneura fumiferana]|uniref:uncharacterized protein isoform X1 n=2 Tax=Choristoneura fumiferana TaxID=7141 RepID=UPI003D155B74